MVKVLVALVMLLFAGTVVAKPLPATMKVTLKKGKPYLMTEGVTVQVFDNPTEWTAVNAELADDDKFLLLWGARCGMELDPEEVPQRIPMAHVNAMIANAKGIALKAKRKYADAAKLFERAWRYDTSKPEYATNLLAALALAGDVARANKLVADGIAEPYVPWFALRFNVDPDLRKLKSQPAGKAFRSEKPGKLTHKKLGEGAAESPLGLVAVRTSDSAGRAYVSFAQLDSGKETLRLPLKTAAEQRIVDGLLASLGFVAVTDKLVWNHDMKQLAGMIPAGLDVQGAAAAGGLVVYSHRTTGCTTSEYDVHVGALKVERVTTDVETD